jgi:hypothetical protein
MTVSGSGIAHRLGMEEATDYIREFLGAPQVTAQVTHHLSLGPWTLATCRVSLDILIQELPGFSSGL